MTNSISTFGSRAMIALLTVLFSATMVLGAVGPAVDGRDAGIQIAGLAKTPGKSAHSLA
jgi:hypothetical protein